MSDLDPLDIEAQEQAEADRKDRQDFIERLEIEDFKWLMSDKRGRRIVWQLLEKTGVYRSCFDVKANIAAFKEGQRNIGLIYTGLVNAHCTEHYNLMIKEKIEDDKRSNKQRNVNAS